MIRRLQNLPLATRIRVLWTSIAVVAVGLFLIMYSSVGSQINKVNTDDIFPSQQNTVTSATHYVKIEWVEIANGKLKIYFKTENTTGSIMNFSKAADTSLSFNDKVLVAEQVNDRQGIVFPIKLLSNSEKFGVIVFEDPITSNVTLKLDQMSFEGDNPTFFHEEFELDLEELNKPLEIRS